MLNRQQQYRQFMTRAAEGDRGAAARLIDAGWFPGIVGPNDIDRVIAYAIEMGYKPVDPTSREYVAGMTAGERGLQPDGTESYEWRMGYANAVAGERMREKVEAWES